MFKVFIDYIYTVDIYLIELIKVDSENNVLSCLNVIRSYRNAPWWCIRCLV